MVKRWCVCAILVVALSLGIARAAETQADDNFGPGIVNLAHLDFLHATVPNPIAPPAGHTTTDPGVPIDTWWVYANYNAADGTYTPTGGGNYNARRTRTVRARSTPTT